MSATEKILPVGLDQAFWEHLERIESRHEQVQSEHEIRRRGLDSSGSAEDTDLHLAWQRYCEVIAELERTSAEFESFRGALR